MEATTWDSNSTTDDQCTQPVLCIVEVIVIIAVTFLILAGNIASLVVLLSTASLRNSHGYLLISLAVADLGIGVVSTLSIYPAATFSWTLDAWPYGDIACLTSAITIEMFFFNSGNMLTFLSIERYIAVVHPLKYSRICNKKATLLCIAISWVAGLPLFVPTALEGGYEFLPELHTCFLSFFGHSILSAAILLTLTIPSTVIIIWSSYSVRRILKESARARSEMMPQLASLTQHLEHQSSTSGATRETIKLFKMVRLMTIALIITWIPYCVVETLELIFGFAVPGFVAFILYWLLLSNSFLNTLIYFYLNKTLRARLEEILRKMVPRFCLTLNDRERDFSWPCCPAREVPLDIVDPLGSI